MSWTLLWRKAPLHRWSPSPRRSDFCCSQGYCPRDDDDASVLQTQSTWERDLAGKFSRGYRYTGCAKHSGAVVGGEHAPLTSRFCETVVHVSSRAELTRSCADAS